MKSHITTTFLAIILGLTFLISCSDSGTNAPPGGLVKGSIVYQVPITNFSGQVLDSLNFTEELDSIPVILQCGCKEEQTTYSIDGKYEFRNIPDGKYKVKAKIGDYVYYITDIDEIHSGDVHTNITIYLRKYEINKSIDLILYPNPVANNASIQFSLATQDNMSAYIVDFKGRIVKTLFENEILPAGTHTRLAITNSDIPSGFYFAVVKNYDEQKPYLAFIPLLKQQI